MLDKLTQMDLDIIKAAIISTWGEDCVIESVEVIDVPVPQFEIKSQLYGKINVGMHYDRGTMSIGIKQDEKYVILNKFTEKKVYSGFEIMEPDIMKHNFSVLDEVVCKLLQQQ